MVCSSYIVYVHHTLRCNPLRFFAENVAKKNIFFLSKIVAMGRSVRNLLCFKKSKNNQPNYL